MHLANMAILVDPARIAVGGGLMISSDAIISALAERLGSAVPFTPGPVRAGGAPACSRRASRHAAPRPASSGDGHAATARETIDQRGDEMSGSCKRLVAVAAAALAAAGLAACGGSNGGGGGGEGKKIALLLPETKTARYEAHDRPDFTAKVKELCPKCEVIYANATQDATKQQTQAEAAITRGADVLVLDAVDAKSATAIVQRAKRSKIPVVAYDRLISGADIDYYVSFNNVRQGRIQAKTLLDKLGSEAKTKPIVVVNGAPTDPSAGDYKRGAHQVFDASGVKVAKEYDTPDWSPDKAQREMDQAVTALGKDGFVGVYSANDGMASGIIAALKDAGIRPSTVPVTGGDAEVAALQRILVGEQYSTIYLTIKKQAEDSAEVAVGAAKGDKAPGGLINARVDNGQEKVPSVLLTPLAVTKDNIKDTVIKDGFYKPSDICTGRYESACKTAGLD
jgi:D-xylose transport system substrate-binding protein